MVTADPFQCWNIHMKRPHHHSLWLCYWLDLWLSKEPTWAGPRTSFLRGHSCERWSYSDLLPLKLQRTQQTLRVKMTFKAGCWRRFGDVSHLSATASSVAERWAESHSSWSDWWSATLIPLSSCCQSLCFHQLLLFCLRFFSSHPHQRYPSGWWDVRTHFIKAPNLQESTQCFYGNHGNETTDFRAMILWRVNLWFNAVNTWCQSSKNERQFPSWYLQRTLFSVLWFWSFNISSVYCFVLENQEIKV